MRPAHVRTDTEGAASKGQALADTAPPPDRTRDAQQTLANSTRYDRHNKPCSSTPRTTIQPFDSQTGRIFLIEARCASQRLETLSSLTSLHIDHVGPSHTSEYVQSKTSVTVWHSLVGGYANLFARPRRV